MRLTGGSSLVVAGMVTAMTGCSWLETSHKSTTLTGQDRSQGHSAMAAVVNRVVDHTERSPTDAVKDTVADFLSILGNEALKKPERFYNRRQLIENIIRHRVDYEEVAHRALGLPWTRLTDTERDEFVSLFVELLRDRLANNIDMYYDEQMLYLSERRKGGFAEVSTHLVGSKVNTSLDFRLRRRSGHWLIYDLVIDGASLVSNYRAQCNRIIRDDSYAGLTEKMKQTNLLVKIFERTAPAFARPSVQTVPQ
jgi:phospholipid transport system substrate-binding protein